MHTVKIIVSTHPNAFQEEVDRFEYFDDLAMRAAIKIVDADDEQVPHFLVALGIKHLKENLQSQQYADIESSGPKLNHVHVTVSSGPLSLAKMPVIVASLK